jgi:ATP-dependent helicase/nuclease subunit B
VFIDARRPVTYHPLIELVRALGEIITTNWPGDSVMRLLKTDLLPCSRDDADRLENFALARGVRGSMWAEPEHWGDAAAASIARRALGPVYRVLGRGSPASLRDMVAPVQQTLDVLDVGRTLERWAQESLERGDPEEASIHRQVYEGVTSVLSQAAQYLGDERLPAAEARQILEVGLRTLTLGLVPPSLDQIIVGSMDRSRHPRVRAAFILGLHDGGFPAPVKEDVVFADRERDEMSRNGIGIGPSGIDRIVEQDFLGYLALSRASERLYLFRPLLDDGGKNLAESSTVTAVKSIFPELEEVRPGATAAASGLAGTAGRFGNDKTPACARGGCEAQEVLDRVYSMPSALRELARASSTAESGSSTVASTFAVVSALRRSVERAGHMVLEPSVERAGRTSAVRFLDMASRRNSEEPLDSRVVRTLVGGRVELSISRLESLLACPFQHFAQYMLKLEERRTAGLDAPRGGLFMHYALTRFVKDVWLGERDVDTITDEEVRSAMQTACDRALIDLAEDSIVEDPVALREMGSMRSALEDAALTLVEHSRRGRYRPVAAEVPFGPGSALAMQDITTESGLVASVTGRIDLVDAAADGEDSFFRVIDFKSRHQRLTMAEILDGIDLQLAGYAAAVLRNPQILPAGDARLVAMLYMGLRGSFTRVDSPLPPAEARTQRLSQRRMSGLVTSDPTPVMLMDSFDENKSVLVPVTLDSSGKPKASSSVIPAEEICRLAEVFLDHAKRGAEMVASGDVRISPFRRGFDTPCGYCRYGALCQFDSSRPENRYRYMHVAGRASGKRGGRR